MSWIVLLIGCDGDTEAQEAQQESQLEAAQSALESQAESIAALELLYSSLEEKYAAIAADNLTLQAELKSLSDTTDLTDVRADIAQNADDIDIISTTLASAATQEWVEGKGYVAGLSDYVSISSEQVNFTGANIFIRSGSGATDDDGAMWGLGNLIIGYNEDPEGNEEQSGSHNLVIGDDHSFESYGGLITGRNNHISGPYASVVGGRLNTASGELGVVVGGERNTASGERSVVGGGAYNQAYGEHSVVSGGAANTASGRKSVVSGAIRM